MSQLYYMQYLCRTHRYIYIYSIYIYILYNISGAADRGSPSWTPRSAPRCWTPPVWISWSPGTAQQAPRWGPTADVSTGGFTGGETEKPMGFLAPKKWRNSQKSPAKNPSCWSCSLVSIATSRFLMNCFEGDMRKPLSLSLNIEGSYHFCFQFWILGSVEQRSCLIIYTQP